MRTARKSQKPGKCGPPTLTAPVTNDHDTWSRFLAIQQDCSDKNKPPLELYATLNRFFKEYPELSEDFMKMTDQRLKKAFDNVESQLEPSTGDEEILKTPNQSKKERINDEAINMTQLQPLQKDPELGNMHFQNGVELEAEEPRVQGMEPKGQNAIKEPVFDTLTEHAAIRKRKLPASFDEAASESDEVPIETPVGDEATADSEKVNYESVGNGAEKGKKKEKIQGKLKTAHMDRIRVLNGRNPVTGKSSNKCSCACHDDPTRPRYAMRYFHCEECNLAVVAPKGKKKKKKKEGKLKPVCMDHIRALNGDNPVTGKGSDECSCACHDDLERPRYVIRHYHCRDCNLEVAGSDWEEVRGTEKCFCGCHTRDYIKSTARKQRKTHCNRCRRDEGPDRGKKKSKEQIKAAQGTEHCACRCHTRGKDPHFKERKGHCPKCLADVDWESVKGTAQCVCKCHTRLKRPNPADQNVHCSWCGGQKEGRLDSKKVLGTEKCLCRCHRRNGSLASQMRKYHCEKCTKPQNLPDSEGMQNNNKTEKAKDTNEPRNGPRVDFLEGYTFAFTDCGKETELTEEDSGERPARISDPTPLPAKELLLQEFPDQVLVELKTEENRLPLRADKPGSKAAFRIVPKPPKICTVKNKTKKKNVEK